MATDISPPIPAGRSFIRSYNARGFVIGDQSHVGPVLVLPDRVLPVVLEAIADLRLEHLEPVFIARPAIEVLLVGSGSTMVMLGRELRTAIRGRGPTVDPMATPAACRTLNVLMAEDRRVAALLFPAGA
ncbi:MAG: hypothetical protein FJX65_09615 [Alphaproteobacteria bacterium]|nr:hypothetical protein [Alphaproteobacteria bacterium]